MERISTLMTSQLTISDLNQAFNRLSRTQQELSSGKRINQPSDDPYGTSAALQLNGQLASLSQYSSNVTDGSGWVQVTDGVLGNMNNVVQRIRELVVEGANGTQSQSARNDTAAEVDQLADALKQEANSTYNGQYVFSGTSTSQPYTVGGADTYAGNSGVVTREIGPKTTVQINTDLHQLLGDGQPDGKLLSVLRDISSDLRSGTAAGATALGTTDLGNLDSNISTLQMLQANVGATENRLSLASSRIQDLQVSQTQELSTVQDADMAQTTIDYSTEQAAYTAALHASANIVQSSLLDFLK